ncbi:hypothetical protein B0J11DRAFT_613044 [Dendryphion nanum]|uniref:Uncharacterized protein n=1 Tax=Dendryphion nanum TaxID=256645 RepID=A0A9P9E4B9_9PLEO|nr:hypothetical protein B0J11DRAFT_613044 [Dendryphion nanum]
MSNPGIRETPQILVHIPRSVSESERGLLEVSQPLRPKTQPISRPPAFPERFNNHPQGEIYDHDVVSDTSSDVNFDITFQLPTIPEEETECPSSSVLTPTMSKSSPVPRPPSSLHSDMKPKHKIQRPSSKPLPRPPQNQQEICFIPYKERLARAANDRENNPPFLKALPDYEAFIYPNKSDIPEITVISPIYATSRRVVGNTTIITFEQDLVLENIGRVPRQQIRVKTFTEEQTREKLKVDRKTYIEKQTKEELKIDGRNHEPGEIMLVETSFNLGNRCIRKHDRVFEKKCYSNIEWNCKQDPRFGPKIPKRTSNKGTQTSDDGGDGAEDLGLTYDAYISLLDNEDEKIWTPKKVDAATQTDKKIAIGGLLSEGTLSQSTTLFPKGKDKGYKKLLRVMRGKKKDNENGAERMTPAALGMMIK